MVYGVLCVVRWHVLIVCIDCRMLVVCVPFICDCFVACYLLVVVPYALFVVCCCCLLVMCCCLFVVCACWSLCVVCCSLCVLLYVCCYFLSRGVRCL